MGWSSLVVAAPLIILTVVGSGSPLVNLTVPGAEILRTLIKPELKCLDLEVLWNSSLQDCTPKSIGVLGGTWDYH